MIYTVKGTIRSGKTYEAVKHSSGAIMQQKTCEICGHVSPTVEFVNHPTKKPIVSMLICDPCYEASLDPLQKAVLKGQSNFRKRFFDDLLKRINLKRGGK